MLAAFIEWLCRPGNYNWDVAHHEILPEKAAQLQPLPDELDSAVSGMIRDVGISAVYSHQAEAIRLSIQGQDVVLSTSTASGKTLAYQAAVLHSLVRDPRSHALFLFPLKALERDQREAFLTLAGNSGISAEVYDGDTPESERRKIRNRPPRVLITNPDMLHLGLMCFHDSWKDFFSHLTCVVLDEVHTYKGIFGSHISQVMLRLQRICKSYGSRPRFVACSATVANPGPLVERLIGRQAAVVDRSGAPSSPRHFVFVNPALSPNTVTARMFVKAIDYGLKTIAFTRARKITELITTWVMSEAPRLRDRISSYRAGFLPEERRDIETKLFSGQMDGVISTSALEMGIDVGGLDVCLLVGYPGTIVNTWQRGGRVGRASRPSAIVLVAGSDALDQYFVRNPRDFFTRNCEEAVLDPFNVEVLKRHIPCAASEIPISPDEEWTQHDVVKAVLDDLQAVGAIYADRYGALHSTVRRPHRDVDLRSIGKSFSIFLEDRKTLVGGSSQARAYKECHQGAVYLHRAKQYVVTGLDLERGNVLVKPARVSYFTRAMAEKDTEILGAPIRSKDFPGFVVREARLKVTETVVGYQKLRTSSQEVLGVMDLDLPPTHFETVGIWIEIPDEVRDKIKEAGLHFMGGIHAMEHAAISMFPLFALCDRDDIGGISTPNHSQVCRAAVFIYDGHPGGVGLAHRAFDVIEELLEKTRVVVEGCTCEQGCPSCIHSPKCGSGNKPLDKAACLRILELLLLTPKIARRQTLRKRPAKPSIFPDLVKDAAADYPADRLATKGNCMDARTVDRTPLAPPSGRVESKLLSAPVAAEAAERDAGRVGAGPESGPRGHKLTSKELPKRAGRSGPSKNPGAQGVETSLPPGDKAPENAAASGDKETTGRGRRTGVVVFDLETQKLSHEVGGWKNISKMLLSLGVAHTEEDGFLTFTERNVSELIELLKQADLVVGFNHLRFDYEVLRAYTNENLAGLRNLDILLDVQAVLGHRLSLDQLAETTLGEKKSGTGIKAAEWFREGRMDLLEQYCRDDVRITRDLYRYGVEKGFLLYRRRDGKVSKIQVSWTTKTG